MTRRGCAFDEAGKDRALRDKATKQLKKRRDIRGHFVAYVLVNGFLVVI
jgi:hypothetical protein